MDISEAEQEIIDEELNLYKRCESCSTEEANYIIIIKSGLCTVISHICWECAEHISDWKLNKDYALFTKGKIQTPNR